MANRAERRRAMKAAPAWERMSTEQRLASLYKNGITEKDISRAKQEGYDKGSKDALDYSALVCYAAAAQAIRKLEKYGRRRMNRFLRELDDCVMQTLDREEAIEQLQKLAGVRFLPDGTFGVDRFEEVAGD